MKKYFLHNGTEEQGPFDIEDLKNKKIKKDTPIWYEGLDNWTTSGKVEELKELFTAVPPPFNEPKKTPPPIQKPTVEKQATVQPTKKKSRTGLKVAIFIFALIIIAVAIMVKNNPNAIPRVKFEINTPKPIVVTSRADLSKSGLLKTRATIYATVLNQGGDGEVLVTFYVSQKNDEFDRTKKIYMRANESQDLEVTFDEVKLLKGDITFHVEATAK